MSDHPKFDYYYGLESEQFNYIKIPKLIIEDMVFYELSDRAKILYGVMLDRMSLSRKNQWIDDQNRVYILFSIDKIAQALNCSKPTACKALAELDAEKGIGLIEKVKRGQGNPDIIYVKNFISYVANSPDVGKEKAWDSTIPDKCMWEREEADVADDTADSDAMVEVLSLAEDPMTSDVPSSEVDVTSQTDAETIDFTENSQNSNFLNSRNLNSRILNSKILTSRIQESLPLEVKDFYPNNTDINNTEFINTENDSDGLDRLGGYTRVVAQIQQNIDYQSLCAYQDEEKRSLYEEIYQLICDVVLVPDEEMKINGKVYPYEMVRQRFMSLRFEHVIYVTECMAENFGKVSNIRNYLITALYNAPLTIQNYSDQNFREANHTKVITRYEYESGERLKALQDAGVIKKYF